jgi:hypothetical protein
MCAGFKSIFMDFLSLLFFFLACVSLIYTLQLRTSSIAHEETNQQMRAKLESALKDEVILLEQIQQLESVKASREVQLAVAREDASREVSYFPHSA